MLLVLSFSILHEGARRPAHGQGHGIDHLLVPPQAHVGEEQSDLMQRPQRLLHQISTILGLVKTFSPFSAIKYFRASLTILSTPEFWLAADMVRATLAHLRDEPDTIPADIHRGSRAYRLTSVNQLHPRLPLISHPDLI